SLFFHFFFNDPAPAELYTLSLHDALPIYEENLVLGADHQPSEKLDENLGVDAAFFLDHEPHVAARSNRRDEAHPVPRSSPEHNRGLSLLAPGAAGMMNRAHMRRVAEIDVGFFSARKGFDLRVFPLEPLLHRRLAAFPRLMQPPPG